ncbi:MAG: hypothetical protein COC03_05605 [Robiginitomaculum sp.]|nr:MAG: hypothetical protein COC03_05605 [Robiginitomaculum sp.]
MAGYERYRGKHPKFYPPYTSLKLQYRLAARHIRLPELIMPKFLMHENITVYGQTPHCNLYPLEYIGAKFKLTKFKLKWI